jgi:hypothetical protein
MAGGREPVAAGPVSTGDPATRFARGPRVVALGGGASAVGPRDEHAAQHAPSRHPRVRRAGDALLRADQAPPACGTAASPARLRGRWPRFAGLPHRKAAGGLLPDDCGGPWQRPGCTTGSEREAVAGPVSVWDPVSELRDGRDPARSSAQAHDMPGRRCHGQRQSPPPGPTGGPPQRETGAMPRPSRTRPGGRAVLFAGGERREAKDRERGRTTRGWRDGACWAAWSSGAPPPGGTNPATTERGVPGGRVAGSPVETGPAATKRW